MIACVSFGWEFFVMLLVPLGICYIFSMYDMLLMICDKQGSFAATQVRNFTVIGICSFYLMSIGISDPFISGICGIPIFVSVLAIIIHYAKINEAENT